MKLPFTVRGNALLPSTQEGRDVLAGIASGKEVMIEIKTARNVRFHRLFFGMLNLLVENSDSFDTVDQALTAVKIATGEVDPVIDAKTGKTFWVTRSIAFESCSQERFSRIFERALFVICDRWLIGTDTETLRAEIFDLVDGDRASSLGRRVENARAA